MEQPNKILFLSLYTFGLTGGIEKVCRTLVHALQNLSQQERKFHFDHYALYDHVENLDTRYVLEKNYRAFAGSKFKFLLLSLWKALNADVLILSHLNLMLIVPILKFLRPNIKIILFAHGIEIWDPLPAWKREILQNDLEIWAVSQFTADKIAKIHQINKAHIITLNNALDPFFNWPTKFEKPEYLLDRFQLDKKQAILFTLTRLSAEEGYKGYDKVLTALPPLVKKYPNLVYLIAGKADDLEMERIEQYVKAYKIQENVKLIGFISENEKADFYSLADIFIMPSTKEGFGIVFIEAAACGTKVIGGNQDGSMDALLNGQLGKLVSPNSHEEIEMAIENSLSEYIDPKQIQNLCRNTFGFEVYQQKIKKLLNLA